MRPTADVPVRITRTVVTVPVERPGIRTVVHVTARDHQPRAVTLPVFSCIGSRRLRLCACLFFIYAAGSSGG